MNRKSTRRAYPGG